MQPPWPPYSMHVLNNIYYITDYNKNILHCYTWLNETEFFPVHGITEIVDAPLKSEVHNKSLFTLFHASQINYSIIRQ